MYLYNISRKKISLITGKHVFLLLSACSSYQLTIYLAVPQSAIPQSDHLPYCPQYEAVIIQLPPPLKLFFLHRLFNSNFLWSLYQDAFP